MSASHSPHGECGLKFLIDESSRVLPLSLPAWGVWVEIFGCFDLRGSFASLPAWGVWVEISQATNALIAASRHSPHGGCGLKYDDLVKLAVIVGHSPHGECGLKFSGNRDEQVGNTSLPAWGVWVEIMPQPLR